MPSRLKEFLQRWAIGTLAVLVASSLAPGIHYQQWLDLLLATFILGLLNTFVRPTLMWLSLPLLLVTLGLFTLVINALLLLFVSWMLSPKFHVESFSQALLGALIISVVTVVLNVLTGSGRARLTVHRGGRKPPPRYPDDGNGPVIDV